MTIPMTPFIRIGLRYLSAALIAKGVFTPEDASALITDPEVVSAIEIAMGVLIAAVTEVWHAKTLKKVSP